MKGQAKRCPLHANGLCPWGGADVLNQAAKTPVSKVGETASSTVGRVTPGIPSAVRTQSGNTLTEDPSSNARYEK